MSNEQLAVRRETMEIATMESKQDILLAETLAQSDILPAGYRGKAANIILGLRMARALNLPDPVLGLSEIYVVEGRPSISGKLGIAALNRSGFIKGRMVFREHGGPEKEDRSVTAVTVDAQSGQTLETNLSWQEGAAMSARKSGGLWDKMPGQMMKYRAALYHIRAYYPDVLMGMQFQEIDETIDIIDAEVKDVDAPRIEPPQQDGAGIYKSMNNVRKPKENPAPAAEVAKPVEPAPAQSPASFGGRQTNIVEG